MRRTNAREAIGVQLTDQHYRRLCALVGLEPVVLRQPDGQIVALRFHPFRKLPPSIGQVYVAVGFLMDQAALLQYAQRAVYRRPLHAQQLRHILGRHRAIGLGQRQHGQQTANQ